MERVCNLYINDTHLMIKLFEHIKKEINKGTRVILLSQDRSKKSIKNMKEKIMQEKEFNNVEILNRLENDVVKDIDNTTIIIQGSNSFIEETEKMLNDLIIEDNLNIRTISCYNINKQLNVCEILSKYEKMLKTTGIVELNSKELQDIKS